MLAQQLSNSSLGQMPKLDWSDFLKKAEAQQIVGITRQWPLACSVTKTLNWRGKVLPLHDRPQMFALLMHLVTRGRAGMTKEEIIWALYPSIDQQTCSARYMSAKRHNAVKMMSRARNMLTEAWQQSGAAGFHWLWLDRDKDIWVLMQPKQAAF